MPNKKWLSQKAQMMGLTLKTNTLKDMPNIPKDFEYELTNLNSVVGWSKSLDSLSQIVFVALTKAEGLVAYAYSQCPVGRVGTCSHAFAVMKLVAKWVIDKINNIPEPKACTSKPCAWSVPQNRERLEKSPILV